MTGVRTCASTGASGCNCSLSGCSCAVLVDFLHLEKDVPRVLLREEPVFLPPFLGFPIVPGIGEAGVDVTSMWKMGSPSSSNNEPVLTVHTGYALLGFTFVAKLASFKTKGLSGMERRCSK